jgi:hypothetical protein
MLQWDAQTLYDRAIGYHVRLSEDGKAVELERGELFEDDGPAAGYSYRPNEETLSGQTWIKKDLLIPNPQARTATLLVARGGDLQAVINGQPQRMEPRGKAGNYWQAYAFDPGVLKVGKNEIVLHGTGKLWIARDDEYATGSRTRKRHPNRSAKSTDGGKTWDYDRLGPDGAIDGEYYVRLVLDHHRPEGSLLLPVIDAGNLPQKAVSPPIASIGPIRIRLQADPGSAGQVTAEVRAGTTYVYSEKTWSGWQALGSVGGVLEKPAGRYLQLRVELKSTYPLASPRLSSLTLEAAPRSGHDWTSSIQVLESRNEPIVRTAVPFEYEPYDHPKLKKLREQHRLDQLVQASKDELELMMRLAGWASAWGGAGRENKAGLLRPDPGYPPWDALEILKPVGQGRVWGGFCQQYNLLLLQACESFGIPGRAVSIGAHEAVELWSNQHRKWVYVDGDKNLVVIDVKTGVPQSLWEIREAAVRSAGSDLQGDLKAIGPGAALWEGPVGRHDHRYYRLIPRSNFLAEPAPVPLNQGMRGWFWTGHYVWDDPRFPAELLYDNRVRRRGDIEWTLNQARYTLEALEKPGELRVHLDTMTPGFETFLAAIDGGEKKPVPPVFTWTLHRGENRLRVLSRNTAGREGISSWITLRY